MKKLQLLVLMMLFGLAAFAQGQPKVYAVINTASWCPACQANGERVEKEIVASYKGNTDVAFLVNNLTDDASKAKSKTTLEEKGVYNSVSSIKGTGQIILVDANTKKVIEQVPVKKSTDEIKAAINGASASTSLKVIAVINTASWCPACQANGKRVETDVVASYKGNESIAFMMNNLSDKKTKKASKKELQKKRVYKSVKKIKSTGLIILVNAETKEVIKQLKVGATTDELKKEINSAIKG
jgi:thiol-disulfide isomerase/thioredoxin